MSDRNSDPSIGLHPLWQRRARPVTAPSGLERRFGDLKVRPKLIVLHNLFFLTLAFAVYFTLIPSFERQVTAARNVETRLIEEIFLTERAPLGLPQFDAYSYAEGAADAIGVPPDVLPNLDANPWAITQRGDTLYTKNPVSGLYRTVSLPNEAYDRILQRARLSLFIVLAVLYFIAVALLEFVIMPRFVYQPIRVMLDADEATRQGERSHELIDDAFIPGDEIGQIMRSRNETVKELRRQEDDLAQALAHLEAQDRLASLGMLSASVAHEMNTPLAVLHGSIEKLLETPQSPQCRERLERMLRVTGRLRKISEGLVDFARVRRDTMGRVELKPLIDEAWGLVSIDDKAAQVRFANEVPGELAVHGNADRLIQVFVNVLRNSLQALQPGGNVRIAARENRRSICTTIEDDGPGISADVLPSIFDAFVSSRLDAKGTGLGLTVAAGIVQQHDGQIHASNRPGGGARLEITLPVASGLDSVQRNLEHPV